MLAAEKRALSSCINAGLRARDGRGYWREVNTAVRQLAVGGCSCRIAADCATAAVAIGAHLRGLIVAAGFKP